MNNLMPVKRWYNSGGKLALVGVGGLVVLFVLGFGGLIGKYWWEIKNGRGDALGQEIYSGFTAVSNNHTIKSGVVNRADLETTDDPFLGNEKANIVVVEFIDFKCPNCLLEEPVLKKVLAKYGGQMKLIVRDFPVETLHPGANQMALMASCAYQQGLYWPMHNWLFNNQADLPEKMVDEDIRSVAVKAGVNADKLSECIKKNLSNTEVNHDYADGVRFGINGTPTFFINGKRFEGAVPFEAWSSFFDKIK